MKQEVDIHEDFIINKLKSLLELKYLYKTTCFGRSLFIIVLKGNCSSLTQELSAMVAKIFQEETDSLFRIFSFDYAEQQLREGNLFFVHGCKWDNVIYKNSDSELDIFHEYTADKKTLGTIEVSFQKECTKITAFIDGATFFIEKENYTQAAFMLHQYIELWYRYAALCIMGKERKSHSIKELQTYLNVFTPELGYLFDTEQEEERILLKLLDDAYVTARYGNNYHITKEQINLILKKANEVEAIISDLFYSKLEVCKKPGGNGEEKIAVNNTKEQQVSLSNQKEILGLFEALNAKNFSSLTPYRFKKGHYTTGIVTKGYLDTSYVISNLIKVCALALEAGSCPTRSIPEPEFNIKEVLNYIIDIIPHKEMELLDTIRYYALESETKNNH